MTKKEYVFKFLDKVEGHWDKEPFIREYLSKSDDVEYTEYLYKEFTGIVDEIITTKEEKKMGGMLKYLDNIKKHEKRVHDVEQQDLAKLEEIRNNIY